jgi:hypothetical protein
MQLTEFKYLEYIWTNKLSHATVVAFFYTYLNFQRPAFVSRLPTACSKVNFRAARDISIYLHIVIKRV